MGNVGLSGWRCDAPTAATGGVEAVGLARTNDIRAVHRITADEQEYGVRMGLHYVKKLLGTYDNIGMLDPAVAIHAVFHGGAGHWLARGRAYAQAVGKNVANPNEEIVAELIRRDVSI